MVECDIPQSLVVERILILCQTRDEEIVTNRNRRQEGGDRDIIGIIAATKVLDRYLLIIVGIKDPSKNLADYECGKEHADD